MAALLERLGMLRSSIWEPPTTLDHFIASPLQFLLSRIYYLLLFLRDPWPRRARRAGVPPIRIVCVSDTHDRTVPLPPGDLLVHAGDLTDNGTVAAIQAQIDWLDAQPHRHKVAIAGNHDSWFDPEARRPADCAPGAPGVDFRSVRYLERGSVALAFDGGRTLNVYGAPDLPQCGGSSFAFQYARHLPPWAKTIPMDTDVLVTHTPPRYHRDLNLGCWGLLQELWRVRPRVHVFGHVHWGKGRETAYFDEAQRAYETLMARPRRGLVYDLTDKERFMDALAIVLYGLYYVIAAWIPFPGRALPGSSCVLVNAAQMHGNTGKMGTTVEVVVI